MTGLTKPCPAPDCIDGAAVFEGADDEICETCLGSGRVPVRESELEAHGQLNALTEE